MKKLALLAALLTTMALPAAAASSAATSARTVDVKGFVLKKGTGSIGSVTTAPAPKRPTKAVTAPVKPKRK